MSQSQIIIAFDLYGTILSTASISEKLGRVVGDADADSVAASWRRYQLEYTWRLNSMGVYRSFSECTRAALRHAVAEHGLSGMLKEGDEDSLMESYNFLHVFPDVPGALEAVKQSGVHAYIFSNGTKNMVTASLVSSPDLQAFSQVFRGVSTVEEEKVFKPAGRVYEYLLSDVGRRAEDVWLVSANPFDVVGARAAGLKVAWVDRAGKGWVDGLGEILGGLRPTIIAGGVDELVSKILEQRGS